jgi:hypothetical protein
MQEKQLLNRLNKAEQRIVDLYRKLSSGGTGENLVSISRQELRTLRNNSQLVVGTNYQVTDSLTNYEYSVPAIPIIMTATSNNGFDKYSIGVFHTVKYNKTIDSWGIWNNIVNANFTNFSGQGYFYDNEFLTTNNGATGIYKGKNLVEYNSGNWVNSTSVTGQWSGVTADISNNPWEPITQPVYLQGSYVRYGGKMWQNVSGQIGYDSSSMFSYPNGFLLSGQDWRIVTLEEAPSFYNLSLDTVIYDLDKDILAYREDSLFNKVQEQPFILENPGQKKYGSILAFQWGSGKENNLYFDSNKGCSNNTVLEGSKIDNINSNCGIENNILRNTSTITNRFFKGIISNNTLSNFNIQNNVSGGNGQIRDNILTKGFIANCDLFQSQIVSNTLEDSAFSNLTGNNYFNVYDSKFIWSSLGNNRGDHTISNSIFTRSMMSNNIFNNATIQSNHFVSSQFTSNIITQTSISLNHLSNSQVTDNTFNQSAFDYNNFDYAQIRYNSCINTFGFGSGGIIANNSTMLYSAGWTGFNNRIQYNTLSGSGSVIANNTLSTFSEISSNVLELGGRIYNNNLTLSKITSNDLLNNSSNIEFNTLKNSSSIETNSVVGGIISNNTLSNNSKIMSCTFLSIYHQITSNILEPLSSINGIDFLSLYSVINSNTLNASNITDTVLDDQNIMDCTFTPGCLLTTVNTPLQGTIRNARFENVTVYGGLSGAINIFNGNVYKTVYEDLGAKVRWYASSLLNITPVSA